MSYGKRRKKTLTLVPFPTGFTWNTAPITIYQNQYGKFETDFDVSTLQYVGTGKTYYVDITKSDANDGLTPATAVKSLFTAFMKEDADIIMVASGYYQDANSNNDHGISKNISIKALPGADVTISTKRLLTFAKTAGRINVYEASRTVVASVYDGLHKDVNGDYTQLTPVGSIAEVDATIGSYYYATPMLYVHTLDSRPADSDIAVFLDIYNVRNYGNFVTYLEGINFEGGKTGAVDIQTTSTLDVNAMFSAKNCTFKYATGGNGGLSIFGVPFSYTQGCVASKNINDGFNYHLSNNFAPKAIEVNCVGRSNGSESNTDNGSTMHDGGIIIRINGAYYNNMGPNVADVLNNTQAWNMGCLGFKSKASNYQNCDFQGQDGLTEMWLDGCISYGSDAGLSVGNTGTGAIMHVHNCKFSPPDLIGTGGTKSSY